MKIHQIALVAIAALACTQPAVARTQPQFHKMTATEEAEMRARIDADFGVPDVDHDGEVSKSEARAFALRHRLGNIVLDKPWNRADTNGNGSLSKAEFIQFAVNLRNTPPSARR